MRRASRVDSNHSEIVDALRQRGYSVLDLSRVGQGCPDLLVARNGMNWLIEIKNGAKSASRIQLTPDEREFHQTWKGRIFIIKSLDDVKQFAEGL